MKQSILGFAVLLWSFTTSPTQAAFQVVQNFSELTTATFPGFNTAIVTAPNDPTNKVGLFGAISGGSSFTNSFATIPLATPIADGTTGTVFTRFMRPTFTTQAGQVISSATDLSFAATVLTETEIGGRPIAQVVTAGFSVQSASPTAVSITAGTWYNLWLVIDNAADTFSIYLAPDGGAQNVTERDGQTVLPLAYDPPAGAAIRTLYFGAFGNAFTPYQGYAAGILYDDIYIDPAGSNLASPVPEPSLTLALLSLVAASFLGRARRIA